MRGWVKRATWRLVVITSGSLFFLQGCDPQTRAAVESGIITSSTSLLAAILRAVVDLSIEKAKQTTTTTTTALATGLPPLCIFS